MNRTDWLKRLNPILFLALVLQVITGAGYLLISGEMLEEVHLFGGFLFIVIAAIHLTLNWTWVRANYFKKKFQTQKG